MNIVLKKNIGGDFCILSAVLLTNGKYSAVGKFISPSGQYVTSSNSKVEFEKERDVRSKVKEMAKIKVKNGWKRVDFPDIPEMLFRYLVVDISLQISSEELIEMIEKSKAERYVVFNNVSGMENKFDVGVEYLAEIGDNANALNVYDKNGNIVFCMSERFSKVVETEKTKELMERIMI